MMKILEIQFLYKSIPNKQEQSDGKSYVSFSLNMLYYQFHKLLLDGIQSIILIGKGEEMKKHFLEEKEYINQVFENDCLDVMEKLPDCCVDMVLCDLPYGTTQNNWDSVIPLEKIWDNYNRIVKENGAIVLTSQGVFTAELIMSNTKDFKYKMIWEKSKATNFLNAKKQPLRKYEDICVFYKKQPVYNPQMSFGRPYTKGIRKNQNTGSYGDFLPVLVQNDSGLRYPSDIIYCKTPESEGDGKVWHPTQKPVELGRYLIKTYTNPGDVVLDNTAGSGSFLVAALLEQRNFIGIEKNADARLFKNKSVDLIDVIKKRLKSAFLSDEKIAFSKFVMRYGYIEELVHDDKSKITI